LPYYIVSDIARAPPLFEDGLNVLGEALHWGCYGCKLLVDLAFVDDRRMGFWPCDSLHVTMLLHLFFWVVLYILQYLARLANLQKIVIEQLTCDLTLSSLLGQFYSKRSRCAQGPK
jgi:hypothetical protein